MTATKIWFFEKPKTKPVLVYIRLNYLLYNPVKHGCVNDLKDYEASSFNTLIEEYGREKLATQFNDYPQYKNLVLSEALEDDF